MVLQAPLPAAAIGVGTQLGDYVIEELIGTGSEGAVYRARDVVLGRWVALKTVREGTAEHTRCVEEARLMAVISHQHVLRVHHARRFQKIWYVALEYAGGGSLQSRVRSLGPLGSGEALRIVAQVVDGLHHVHGLGIIHRDVKPQNLLLSVEGDIKISDFGLAIQTRSEDGYRGPGLIGTPAFLAPERWSEGPIRVSGDVYSLGVCLFFMLTGQLPFVSRDPEELRRAHMTANACLPDEVPKGVRELVAAMMAKTPEARPQLGSDLHSELERLAASPRSAYVPPDSRRHQKVVPTLSTRRHHERCAKVLESHHFACERAVVQGKHCLVRTSDVDLLERFWGDVVRDFRGRYALITSLTGGSAAGSLICQLKERAGLAGGGSTVSALRSLRDRVSQARGVILEVRVPKGTLGRDLGELQTLLRAAADEGVRVAALGAPSLELPPGGSELQVIDLPHAGANLRELISAWLDDFAAGELVATPDAVRLVAQTSVGHDGSWVQLLERSATIAAASGQRVVSTWAVQRALGAPGNFTDLADVPVEMRSRPEFWPPSDLLQLLKDLRVLASAGTRERPIQGVN